MSLPYLVLEKNLKWRIRNTDIIFNTQNGNIIFKMQDGESFKIQEYGYNFIQYTYRD